MELSNILYAVACIAGISTIPIRVYKNKYLAGAYGLENMRIDPVMPYKDLLLGMEESINYYSTDFSQIYGTVRHGCFIMILGPIGQTRFTIQEQRNYAFVLGLSPMDFDSILAAMRQIPLFTPENFLHLLLLLNFYFNGERLDISDIAAYLQINERQMVSAIPGEFDAEPPEAIEPPHFTRSYEQEMLNFVREGDLNGLKSYLSSRIHGRAGTLSHNSIRQQKNLVIVTATLVSRAAMDGGLYEDEAYALSDMYIRRCEDLFSIEALMHLCYEMALDFTKRVLAVGVQTVLSPIVASVVTYIRKNISGDLTCNTLSKHFSMNRNRLSAQFKEDTGKTLSEFVFHEKIRRAKSLLVNTDKTLSSIAEYLGFSSQSHFQNAFKRHMNQTPSEYRAERQKAFNNVG